MICGSGGSKSSLAKAAGVEPAGQMRDEKLHAVVAQSTRRSKNEKTRCTKHTSSGPLLEVEMLKRRTPLWREAHFQVNTYKTPQLRTAFGSWDVEKVRRCGAKHILKSKCEKHRMLGRLLDVQISFRVAGARDSEPCQKWAKKCEGFVAFPKTMAGVGLKDYLKRICKDAFSVAGAVQETCSWELLGGLGANFLRGVAFWSIRFL